MLRGSPKRNPARLAKHLVFGLAAVGILEGEGGDELFARLNVDALFWEGHHHLAQPASAFAAMAAITCAYRINRLSRDGEADASLFAEALSGVLGRHSAAVC